MASFTRIAPRIADLGEGMSVRRVLPNHPLRMVGGWCFLDHAGPVDFASGRGMHVGAHPHIGLQTFTWMIEGEVLHRDSLGNEQVIRPGQVNLMTAGRGIAHTEDSTADGGRLHAVQLWIALPPEAQEVAPDFSHYPDLPRWSEGGAALTLLAGEYAGHRAPARLYSPLLGVDLVADKAATLTLERREDFEYGVLPLIGEVRVDGEPVVADELAYLSRGAESIRLEMAAGSRALLLGGEPFAKPVSIWWNFVAFDKNVFAVARQAWENDDARFGRVGDGSARRLKAPSLPVSP